MECVNPVQIKNPDPPCACVCAVIPVVNHAGRVARLFLNWLVVNSPKVTEKKIILDISRKSVNNGFKGVGGVLPKKQSTGMNIEKENKQSK